MQIDFDIYIFIINMGERCVYDSSIRMMWMIGLEVWDLKTNINYIVLVIFISEGNRSLWRQLMTCRKSLKNYHIRLSSTSNSELLWLLTLMHLCIYVQHDFDIWWCSCHLTVTRRGVTSGAGTGNPTGSTWVHPRFLVGFIFLDLKFSVLCIVDDYWSFCLLS
jgi:hypothetical protein